MLLDGYTTVLSEEPDGNLDNCQFREISNIETFNDEIRTYRDRLREHGVETVIRELPSPNVAYSADVYLGFGGLYLSWMTSEVSNPRLKS